MIHVAWTDDPAARLETDVSGAVKTGVAAVDQSRSELLYETLANVTADCFLFTFRNAHQKGLG